MKMRGIYVALVAVVAIAAVVWADTATTVVYFNTPSSISFTITLPGESALTSATADIEFNSSVVNASKINATVRDDPFSSQTSTIPIFNYTNTGNVQINITLQFDSALPAGVDYVAAGLNDSAWADPCTGTILPEVTTNNCVNVTDTAAVTVAMVDASAWEEVWLWANYTDYSGGSSNSRTLTHTSLAA